MKKLLGTALLSLSCLLTFAQCNCGALRSKLSDVVLSSDLTASTPISNPAQGLLVYNTGGTQTPGYYLWLNGWSFVGASEPLSVDFAIVNSGFTGWTYGTLATLNPTLNLYKGVTYRFNVSNNTAHPFRIATSNTLSPPSSNPAYTNGTTNQDATNGTLTFLVPANAPAALYYLCTVHAAMRGSFTILP